MRLFVAVIPPQEVLDAIERIPRPHISTVRWTTREQWHVTLRFLGNVEDQQLAALSLSAVPSLLNAEGASGVVAVLGPSSAWFPGRRILQIPVAGLDDVARATSVATSALTDEDPDPHSGHLTLARARGRARGPAELAGAELSASWPVDGISLVASELGSSGARYTVLQRVSLT